MKNILLFLLIILSSLLTVKAQPGNRYVGVYGQGSNKRLYIFPNRTYLMTNDDDILGGTWKEHEQYLIMTPDSTINKNFYVLASYIENQNHISVQFHNFINKNEKKNAVYSLNKGEKNAIMHPVFNPAPDCFSFPYIATFQKGDYTQIQVAQLDGSDRGSTSVNHSSMQNVLTFAISNKYNDYKIILNQEFVKSNMPFFAVLLDNKKLYFNTHELHYIGTLESAKETIASLGKPLEQISFSEGDDDINLGKVDYINIPYKKNEYKKITFDENNLFTAICNNSIKKPADSPATSTMIIEADE